MSEIQKTWTTTFLSRPAKVTLYQNSELSFDAHFSNNEPYEPSAFFDRFPRFSDNRLEDILIIWELLEALSPIELTGKADKLRLFYKNYPSENCINKSVKLRPDEEFFEGPDKKGMSVKERIGLIEAYLEYLSPDLCKEDAFSVLDYEKVIYQSSWEDDEKGGSVDVSDGVAHFEGYSKGKYGGAGEQSVHLELLHQKGIAAFNLYSYGAPESCFKSIKKLLNEAIVQF